MRREIADEWSGFSDNEKQRGSTRREITEEERDTRADDDGDNDSDIINQGDETAKDGYTNDGFDDDQSLDGSDLKAQWAKSSDPKIAQLEYFIKKGDDFGYFRQKLVNHLAFKERNPQDAAEDIRKKKRYLALNIPHRFTTEEWYEAIGEDNIPSPPYYTMGPFILDKGFPKEINQRLEGWAEYDPQGNDLQNLLRS
ncbi:hypothetical protein MMC22_010254, partial [Lobaria immixta]|nr:hypothetical protein [Lobaria immixta]